MIILSTNGWSRTAPDGALEALYVADLCMCEGLFLAQPLLRVKESERLPRGGFVILPPT
jgi:hypothetical protein